jgi:hypothetical protein
VADDIEWQLSAMESRWRGEGGDLVKVAEQVGNLKSEYKEFRDKKDKTPKEQEAFSTFSEALADGLPGMTQGTLNAITAFREGNALSGSAAIMDICSSFASSVGLLSEALGPYGAAFGALFSLISMILNFCQPKAPDLIEQIEKLLRDLGAEDTDIKIKAAGTEVSTYAIACDTLMQLDGGKPKNPKHLTAEIKKLNLIEGNFIDHVNVTRQWLRKDGNQSLDLWPEVLETLCQVYRGLMLAITKQNLYANDKKIKDKYNGPPGDWEDLQDTANLQFLDFHTNSQFQLQFLNEMVPIARNRGTFVLAWSNQAVAGTGKQAIQDNRWDQIFGNTARMSITRPKGGVNKPPALYDLWVLDSGSGRYAFHDKLNARTRRRTGSESDYVGGRNGTARLFLDWWAVPAPAPADGETFTVYGTRDYQRGGAVESWTWNRANGAWDRINWRPTTANRITQVRIPTLSAAPLSDDPNKGDAPDLRGANIIYGTIENSTEIFVWYGGQFSLKMPFVEVYSGIEVDPYFLWVYGRDGIRCATHASVTAFLTKKIPMPHWLGPPPQNNPSNVVALSACEDGTLFFSTRDHLSTMLYHIDFKSPTPLTVEERVDFGGQWNVPQVQKLPVFGWPMIESSLAALRSVRLDSAALLRHRD